MSRKSSRVTSIVSMGPGNEAIRSRKSGRNSKRWSSKRWRMED